MLRFLEQLQRAQIAVAITLICATELSFYCSTGEAQRCETLWGCRRGGSAICAPGRGNRMDPNSRGCRKPASMIEWSLLAPNSMNYSP